MKKLIPLAAFLLISYFASAQAVQDWTSGLPTLATYNNHTIATDSQGNVYSVGTYDGVSRDFDSGTGVFTMSSFSNNMYIVKVNAMGNFVWAKQIGGGTTYAITTATAITIDALDNIYISGSTNKIVGIGNLDFDPGVGLINVVNPTGHYIMYILKLDINGNYIWDKQFYNPSNTQYDTDKIQALKIDTAGNIYATGGFNGTVDFDPSSGVYNVSSSIDFLSTQIFILKLDSTGSFVWAKSLPNTSGTTSPKLDKGYSIDIDSMENVYTTGYYTFSIDADPSAAVHNLNINPTINGVQYISKLNASGDYVWAYDILGQHNNQFLPSIAVDSSNNIIVTGDSFSVNSSLRDLDFGSGTYFLPDDTGSFILKIDANAAFIWAKSTARTTLVSGSSANYSSGLVLDSSGNIYTSGAFGSNVTADFDPSAATFLLTSAGNYDGYISKLDTNGNFIWANKIGGTGIEFCYALTLSTQGKITVCGSSDTGFAKSAAAVTTGGFLASFTQPALANSQFNIDTTMSVYPNPTTGNFNITVTNDLVGAKATIFNILGQKVKYFTVDDLTTNQNLDKGMYLIEIKKDAITITKKLIVN